MTCLTLSTFSKFRNVSTCKSFWILQRTQTCSFEQNKSYHFFVFHRINDSVWKKHITDCSWVQHVQHWKTTSKFAKYPNQFFRKTNRSLISQRKVSRCAHRDWWARCAQPCTIALAGGATATMLSSSSSPCSRNAGLWDGASQSKRRKRATWRTGCHCWAAKRNKKRCV